MDKRDLSHHQQKGWRKEPQTTVTLPNPYKSNPSFYGNHTLLASSESAVDASGLGNQAFKKSKVKVKKELTGPPCTKHQTLKGKPNSPGHERKDLKRRGRDTSESVTFQVKMDEFPELKGIFVNQAEPNFLTHCWVPPPDSLEENFDTALKGNKNTEAKNYKPQNCAINSSTTNTKAQDTFVTNSWASIASQPPKTPQPNTTSKSAQVGEANLQEEKELDSGKKKRRRKKKKAKTEDEDALAGIDKNIVYQDPPRFEDEDEFPGLGLSFTGTGHILSSSKITNLCKNENQRPINLKRNNTQSGKSPCTATPKVQKAEKVSNKKSKVPVQLDIGNMLSVLEKKQAQKNNKDLKPLTLSVGGGLPVVPKQQTVHKKPLQQGNTAHNPLDSTCPLVKKGKQREVPKAKKPTALKKVILKEREERKQRRLLEERGDLPHCESVHVEEAVEEEEEEEDCETNAADGALNSSEELDNPAENNEEPPQELTSSPSTNTHVDKPKIHSRKFREYCTQMLSKDVDECVTALLKELVRFQDRLYQKDPQKARMKRRIVMGLREVLKHLKLKKVKCVIISPNCERSQAKGGLDEALHTIIDMCREQEVPFIFALSRKALGRCVNKAVPVSLVGIFNFDGAQDIYHKMIELSSEARTAYEAMLLSLEQGEPATDKQPFVSDQIETNSEEPEYITLWKKLLEKESNFSYVNFEEQLSSLCLESEHAEHNDAGMS